MVSETVVALGIGGDGGEVGGLGGHVEVVVVLRLLVEGVHSRVVGEDERVARGELRMFWVSGLQ